MTLVKIIIDKQIWMVYILISSLIGSKQLTSFGKAEHNTNIRFLQAQQKNRT